MKVDLLLKYYPYSDFIKKMNLLNVQEDVLLTEFFFTSSIFSVTDFRQCTFTCILGIVFLVVQLF